MWYYYPFVKHSCFPISTTSTNGTTVNCDLLLTFNDDNECTITSGTTGVSATGSGKFVEDGEKILGEIRTGMLSISNTMWISDLNKLLQKIRWCCKHAELISWRYLLPSIKLIKFWRYDYENSINKYFGLALLFISASCADDKFVDFKTEKPESIAQYEYLNAYDALKTYIDRSTHPNFKLGVGVAANDFLKGEMVRSVAVANLMK